MFVIEVIPLSRTAPEALSYRSASRLAPGTIVDVMLRKKKTQGIVVSSRPVLDAKAELKNASYALRGITLSPSGTLPEHVMASAETLAAHYATTAGAVLSALFSEHIRSDVPLLFGARTSKKQYEEAIVEASIPERIEAYRAHIERTFKNSHSALLIAPTIAEGLFWKGVFKEYAPRVLSGALSAHARKKVLEEVAGGAGLVIATPSFAWTPIYALGAVILDRVSAGTYTLPKRPYIDVVVAARLLAKEQGLVCVLGDYPLPLEYRPHPAHLLHLSQKISVIDARRDKDAQNDMPWQVFPEPVTAAISAELAAGETVLVMTARTGYAPAVVCRDCGQTVVDAQDRPLTFSTSGGARVLRSTDGTIVESANVLCARCGSWNLMPLGVGQERVEEALKLLFPETPVTIVTQETLKRPLQVRNLLTTTSEHGGIIVGTESVLPWILRVRGVRAKLPLAVIASADSWLALPFWRARERFVRLALFLSGVARQVAVVTYRPEDAAVRALSSGTIEAFFTEEVELRKALGFPPFGTILAVSTEGSIYAVEAATTLVLDAVAGIPFTRLPDRTLSTGAVLRTFAAMLPSGAWPNAEIAARIAQLPPSVKARIDPETI